MRIGEVLSVRQVRQMAKAEEPNSVTNRNNDNIRIFLHEVMHVISDGSACLKSTAVYPHHDRLLFITISLSLPHIQIQAVLTLYISGREIAHRLAGGFPVVKCLINTVVGNDIHRRLPPQVTYRLLAHKRNSFVFNYVFILFADKCSVYAFNRQRLVVIIIGDAFIFAVERSYHLYNLIYFIAVNHITHYFFLLSLIVSFTSFSISEYKSSASLPV